MKPAAARYDISRSIAGFDFFNWLVQEKAAGATEIVFGGVNQPKDHKWSRAEVLRRFESILLPGPALAGLPCRVGDGGVERGSVLTQDLVQWCRKHGRPPRLTSVLPPGKARFTVTLRRTERSPNRNSDEDVWREFAAEIGATVIEDYAVQTVHLHERVALYAGAEMNLFVTNGPAGLCSLTPYPMMMFDCDIAMGPNGRYGVPFGTDYLWMMPNQCLVWEAATAETIRRHFYHWLNEGQFLRELKEPT